MDRGEDEGAGGGHVLQALVRGPEVEPAEQRRGVADDPVEDEADETHHARPLPVRQPLLEPLHHARRPTISSTTSSTERPVLSITTAPSGMTRGETARVESMPVAAADVVGVLVGPALGPFLGRGREEHLELGVGEDHAADVAALHDRPAVVGDPLPLEVHQGGADVGHGRHLAHHAPDVGAADLVGDVVAVDRHPAVAQLDLEVLGDGGHLGRVVGGAPPEDGGGHRPVHGARLQAVEAEAVGHGPGHGGLARPDGTVDGDDTHRRRSSSKPG